MIPRGTTTQPPPQAAPGSTASRTTNPWIILSALCLGFFMILLDTTIVNIAIPDLATKLNASLDDILWVLNSYVLVYAVLLITAGRLGDLYGPKPLFLGGLVLFTVASVGCGFAQSPTQLVAGRVVQGIGGALLTPQTLSVITVIFPPARRGAAFGVWGGVAGVATIAGPTLGGLIVTTLGWRWVFFVNLPIGIIALVFGSLVMPNLKPHRSHRLDLTGTGLVTLALLLIVFGLIEGESYDWGTIAGPVTIPMVIGAGFAVLTLFVWHQYLHRDDEPLIPFALFRNRDFTVMSVIVSIVGLSMTGMFLPMVIFLQSVLQMDALHAGLTAAPMSAVSMVVAPFSGRLADRIGGKYILVAGLGMFAAGTVLLLHSTNVHATALTLLPGLLVAGLGLGMTFAPMQTIAMRDIVPAMAGAASGVNNTMRQLGTVVGTAATGALLQSQLSAKLSAAATTNSAMISDPAARARFVAEFHNAAHSGLAVGAGQTGVHLPAGLPPALAAQITRAGAVTFEQGFTGAMRTTMLLPIIGLAIGSIICLAARDGSRRSGAK